MISNGVSGCFKMQTNSSMTTKNDDDVHKKKEIVNQITTFYAKQNKKKQLPYLFDGKEIIIIKCGKWGCFSKV